MQKRAVFLDRDGVINASVVQDGKPYPPASLQELKILPQVLEALQNLKSKGYLLIVVTNQPDVAKGKTTIDKVEAIHQYLMQQLPLDDIKTCFHIDDDGCGCRKPKPGLLLDAAKQYNIDVSKSFMVGDRWRDIEAGQAAGCKTVWMNYHYQEKQPQNEDYQVNSLYEMSLLVK